MKKKQHRKIILYLILSILLPNIISAQCSIQCNVNQLNISTGFNLPPNAPDPNWVITNNPFGPQNMVNAVTVPQNSGNWVNVVDPNTNNASNYIIPPGLFQNDPNFPNLAVAPTNSNNPVSFTYTFCVCTGGSFNISGAFTADNFATLTLIPNVLTTNQNAQIIQILNSTNTFLSQSNFNIPVILPAGTHRLVINLNNAHGPLSPTGVSLAGSITSAAQGGGTLARSNCCVNFGTVTGTKFHDANNNGIIDNSDPTLPNWTFNLSNGTNNYTTTTDANGNFTFTNVPAGNYTLSEVVPTGWFAISPNGGTSNLAVTAGNTVTRNFLNAQCNLGVTVDYIGDIQCNGSCDGIINTTISGSGVITWNWTGPTTPPPLSDDIFNLCPGVYTLTVSNLAGCTTTTGPIQVADNTTPITIASSATTPVSCGNTTDGTINIQAAGGVGNFQYTAQSTSTMPPYGPITNSSGNFQNVAAGTYSISILDGNNCSSSTTISVGEEQDCCFALIDPAYIDIHSISGSDALIDLSDDPTPNDSTIVLHGKYYISEPIDVEHITLDITNCDLVFDQCAYLRFADGSTLRANNSVFRPCAADKVWGALVFDNAGNVNIINECTFKNAFIGTAFFNSAQGKVQNNLFNNCNVGVFFGDQVNQQASTYPITGNSFIIDQDYPDSIAQTCQFGQGWPYAIGIVMAGSQVVGEIAQNTFVNNYHKESMGILLETADSPLPFNAKISQNTFTDFTHGICINNAPPGGLVAIENNEFENSRIFKYGSSQIKIQDAHPDLISIISNEFRSTMNINDISSWGIEISNSTEIEFLKNDITGSFTAGIYIEKGFNNSIRNNKISKTTKHGIILRDCSKSDIKCNEIEGIYGTSAGLSILDDTQEGSNDIEIYGNCILNTTRAIQLYNTNGGNGKEIYIRNNFMYNYKEAGIYNDNYIDLAIGWLSPRTYGYNTFMDNTDQSGSSAAVDIFANVPTSEYGNYDITVTSSSVVSHTTNDDIRHSIAACATQIDPDPAILEYQEFDEENFSCDFTRNGNWTNEFQPLSMEKTFQELPSDQSQYDHAEQILNTLASKNMDKATAFYNWLKTQNVLGQYHQKILDFTYQYIKKDHAQAYSILTSLNLSEQDRMKLLDKRIYLEDLLNIRPIELLDNSTLNELRRISLINENWTNPARLILMQQKGESHIYVSQLPESSQHSSGTLVNSLGNSPSIRISPNPANETLRVELMRHQTKKASIIITNVLGQLQYKRTVQISHGSIEIPVASLPSGTYILSLTGEKGFTESVKFNKR